MSNERKQPGSQEREQELKRPEEMIENLDDAIEDLQPADQDAETVTGGSIWSTVKDATVMGAEKTVLENNGMLRRCNCF